MKTSSVVFLHGFPLNGTTWSPQVQHFKNKFSRYAPDLRGHGSGSQNVGPWMIAHFVEDLKRFLDDQKIQKTTLCGVSMGGYVALQFVNQYPDRVQSLILSDTRADGDSNEAKDKRFATVQKIHKDGLQSFASDFVKSALSETTLQNRPELQKELENIIVSNRRESLAMVLGALASRKDSTPYLKEIKCPTLVIVGAEDKITPVEANEALAKGIPGAQFRKIEHAGHFPNLEQPEKFNALMEEFLS